MRDLPENYREIHWWLAKNFGKANHCENPNCKHKSNNFNWALKKDKEYDFIRENFMQLCRSCHILYDKNLDTNKKISQKLLGRKFSKEHKLKISKSLTGFINWNLILAAAEYHKGKPSWNKGKKFKWINNNKIEKQIPFDKPIPKSYKNGRLCQI